MDEHLSLEQAFINKLTKVILDNLENKNFGVEELSHQMDMSHSTIHRKVKLYRNQSICQFVREVRLKRAHEMIQQDLGTISEISYKVGFSSPTYFDKCFHEYYGYPPGDVKKHDQMAMGPASEMAGRIGSPEDKTLESPQEWFSRLTDDLLKSLSFVLGVLSIWVAFLNFPGESLSSDNLNHSIAGSSIAVFPFRNLNNKGENQYFAYCLTGELFKYLNKIKELRVVLPPAYDKFYKDTVVGEKIAKELKVNYLLEGSALKSGDRISVIVKLTDGKTGKQIWSERYDNGINDIFFIESEITKQIAGNLHLYISKDELRQILKKPAKNADAYNLYLQGLYYAGLETIEGLKKSVTFFEEAIGIDQNYALAYTAMADSYFTQTYIGYYPAHQGYIAAKEYIRKALELNPDCEVAHATLGRILAWGDLNWDEACKEFEHALDLNHDCSLAHLLYSEVLHIIGENNQERIHIDKYLELNPYSETGFLYSMMNYYDQGMFNEALEVLMTAEKFNLVTFNAYGYFFYIYMYLGDDANAIKSLQKYFSGSALYAKYAGQISHEYSKSGLKGILRWLNDIELSLDNPDPWLIAKRYAILGENEKALDWLEIAYKKNNNHLPAIYNSYDFSGLRKEPRFLKLLKQLGLPDYKTAERNPFDQLPGI